MNRTDKVREVTTGTQVSHFRFVESDRGSWETPDGTGGRVGENGEVEGLGDYKVSGTGTVALHPVHHTRGNKGRR